MSIQPRPWPEVPQTTAAVARAANRKGNLAMRIRDVLGEVYDDERFTDAFAVRGRPGISPGQLMLITVMQFAENLTDRQAAEAVRDRITWKYMLGLELDDPGFDASVLCEWRARLVAGGMTDAALDTLLERLIAQGLLKDRGRMRTDSTHVHAAIRQLNRLELAGETVRATLEALAVVAPDWLTGLIDDSWQKTYTARIEDIRLPRTDKAREALLMNYARDGYVLLDAVTGADAPVWLGEVPAVAVLKAVWAQQFAREHDGKTTRIRHIAPGEADAPSGADRITSPWDTDARWSTKRDTTWTGYKVHFTETCDAPTGAGPDTAPNLITDVLTTAATVPDSQMTAVIHQRLYERDLLPAQHLVDSGYPSAENIVAAGRRLDIDVIAPVLLDHSAQATAGQGYDKASFTFDFDARTGTCPQGWTSSSWTPCTQNGKDAIVVTWKRSTCGDCPVRGQCTKAKRRSVTVHPRPLHEAIVKARARQKTKDFKDTYRSRAGVEGTMRQATHVTGIRTARYRGLAKTALEHNVAAAAINFLRLEAYWTGRPLDRTRTGHLARLDFTLAA